MPTMDDAAHLLEMPDDDYMNGEQLAFFRCRLLQERALVEERLQEVRLRMSARERSSDDLDQAAQEEELQLQLRQADRETRLLANIASALKRVETGEYGYCEETGVPIGLPRLLHRPTARLCLEAKQRQEQREHHFARTRK
ncbi:MULTISPECIES: TraR/DksA C4-type zinc finger protein [unclassified Halomonas]|uniref:TraR/DksA C4-type zinc finger protein n=1 Tax=Halomonas sp. H10-59 TaxID=2950874 RepID=A0AAU7KTY4_9GAMM|nr:MULTISPECIES: TraR/DksA C4-type zinc finger protein [unclassified Halomonas]MBR9771099.1 RNA polymerase-binding protein DksA [Gammaproteobacteria bacterium]MCJ8285427.1 TraR/DksA C4-type zinc finger protein [Halomonas sp.]MCO7214632.1 TraR/DksA C4-type zinc finger protein [Halomonas sp. OfavH-34-E]NQY70826.1 TraR/DksA C4-type zinc finger protein [Halomonas sp.]RQW72138.1 RNA polymerase-binding protein DksA [Halomonas sp. YLB-10]